MNTIEKARELTEAEEFEAFKNVSEISLADAIRMGSSNTEKAIGWGDGDKMCALHAATSAVIGAMLTGEE